MAGKFDPKDGYRWWSWDIERPHKIICDVIHALDSRQQYRLRAHKRHLALYTGAEELDLWDSYNLGAQEDHMEVKAGFLKSLVDTAVSKISAKEVRPWFQTAGGDWEQRERAKQLNKFSLGLAIHQKFPHKNSLAFRDACIFDIGLTKTFIRDGKIMHERVLPWEVLIDEAESRYGMPRTIYQIRELDRDYAIEMWPDSEVDLLNAGRIRGIRRSSRKTDTRDLADVIEIAECWHISEIEGQKSRRTVVCNTGTLEDEEYPLDRLPFTTWYWNEPVVGAFGIGLVRECAAESEEYSDISEKAQDAMRNGGFWIFARKGAFPKNSLDNTNGQVHEYEGVDPGLAFQTPNTVSSEMWQQMDRLEQLIFRRTGISQLSAQASKPAGLNSGVALNTFYDIESERFQSTCKLWTDSNLDCISLALDWARVLSEDKENNIEVMAVDPRTGAELIKWSDVDMDRDKYVLQSFPTNFLSATPAGKKQDVIDMVAAKIIGPEDAAELLHYPDIDGVLRRKNASWNYIQKQCDNMIYKNEPESPDPNFDPALIRAIALGRYQEACADGVPQERMELLRTYLVAAQQMAAMSQQAQQPQQPQQMQQVQPQPQ